MKKITFCIPSKNNCRYLKACIPSIRKNSYRDDHDIIVFVDADNDGTVKWLKSVKDKYNLKYIIMRPSALYGTRDLITRVISQMTYSAITKKKIFVRGPNNKLDFSWVEDVADAFARVTTQPIYNEVFNCTRGKGVTIMKAAKIIQNILGGEIIEEEQDLLTSNRDTLNSCKIKNMTRWDPKVDIEEGIPRYINWFKKNYNV